MKSNNELKMAYNKYVGKEMEKEPLITLEKIGVAENHNSEEFWRVQHPDERFQKHRI